MLSVLLLPHPRFLLQNVHVLILFVPLNTCLLWAAWQAASLILDISLFTAVAALQQSCLPF
jgi:hypothetical protein